MKKYLSMVLILFSFIILSSQSSGDRGLTVQVKNLDKNASLGKQYFVFIAIDRYQKWPVLQKAVSDTKELKNILTSRYYADEVIELYDAKATKSEILKQLVDLSGKIAINDSLFIYYAGHGYVDKNTNSGFWIPVNAGTDQYAQENWLPNTQIKGILKNVKALHICLLSDSCYSGNLTRSTPKFESNAKDYFKNAYTRCSRQVLTSGASNETVPDDSEFTLQLKMYLERNNEPYVDPIMIYNQIRLGMSLTTPIYGEYKDLGQQEGGSFILFLKDKKNEKVTAEDKKKVVIKEEEKSKEYGSIKIEVKENGKLYIDNEYVMDVKANKITTLSDIEAGTRNVRIEYGDKTENLNVNVEKNSVEFVAFSYMRSNSELPKENKNMVYVQGDTFKNMNSNYYGKNVTISNFWIGKYEVTVSEFKVFVNETGYKTSAELYGGWIHDGKNWVKKLNANWKNPYFSQNDNHPVVLISWYDCIEYCNWRSKKEGLTPYYIIDKKIKDVNNKNKKDKIKWTVTVKKGANGYRLPTEAEWEYASSGGQKSNNYKYSGSDNIDEVAWYTNATKESRTREIGTKKANEMGIYDMSGNVWEWCWDWFGEIESNVTDPAGGISGSFRVLRGGCCASGDNSTYPLTYHRYNGYQNSGDYNRGFRLARTF